MLKNKLLIKLKSLDTKRCTSCLKVKKKSEYYSDEKYRLGIKAWCSACFKKHRNMYYCQNRKKIKEKSLMLNDRIAYNLKCLNHAHIDIELTRARNRFNKIRWELKEAGLHFSFQRIPYGEATVEIYQNRILKLKKR